MIFRSFLASCITCLVSLASIGCGNRVAEPQKQAKVDRESVKEIVHEPAELPQSTVPLKDNREGNRIRTLDAPSDRSDETGSKEPKSDANLVLDLATFMGTKGKGKRFCIIADASNSMRGAPMAHLKTDIIKTLTDLKPTSQFYVIFFNSSDVPMPYPTWLNATPENVDKVKPWVNGMGTLLKTLPQSAFERAFRLNPKPDVIFFMTDGMIQGKPDPISQLKSLNASEPKTTIHTIMFTKNKVNQHAESQLRSIAELNRGVFRHVTQK